MLCPLSDSVASCSCPAILAFLRFTREAQGLNVHGWGLSVEEGISHGPMATPGWFRMGRESGRPLKCSSRSFTQSSLSPFLYCILSGHRALYAEALQSSKRKTTLASRRGGTQSSAFSTSPREFLRICLPKCAGMLSVVTSSPFLVSMLVYSL